MISLLCYFAIKWNVSRVNLRNLVVINECLTNK